MTRINPKDPQWVVKYSNSMIFIIYAFNFNLIVTMQIKYMQNEWVDCIVKAV